MGNLVRFPVPSNPVPLDPVRFQVPSNPVPLNQVQFPVPWNRAFPVRFQVLANRAFLVRPVRVLALAPVRVR